MGTHLSARVVLVFACLAVAIWKMYDFLRPGVSASKEALGAEFSFNRSAAPREWHTRMALELDLLPGLL